MKQVCVRDNKEWWELSPFKGAATTQLQLTDVRNYMDLKFAEVPNFQEKLET